MNFFYVKLSCPKASDDEQFGDLVRSLSAKEEHSYHFKNIPNRLTEAISGDLVVVQLGGDASDKRRYFDSLDLQLFKNALYGICKISDVFSGNKEFKGIVFPIESTITKIDLYLYPQFIDNLGIVTKGIATQAGLYELSEETAFSFFDYLNQNALLGESSKLVENLSYAGALEEGVREFMQNNSSREVDSYHSFLNAMGLEQTDNRRANIGSSGQIFDSNFSKHFFECCKSNALQLTNELTDELVSAVLSKQFSILTGLSGSGKTQLAQAFTTWICESEDQRAVIPVGADWTSNENLLGYPDALSPKSYRKPDNGALDLILRAQENPKLPYFLILDEMNLSHVERYFADFLSAMESGEAISLHDDTGEDWNAGDGSSKVPAKLKIPKNLFVIGTVNVDETTYMFSPKVLDRANVIEFRVSDDEMRSFLENPVKPDLDAIAGQGAQYAEAFVAAAKQKDVFLDNATKTVVSEMLMLFFPKLKEAGAEFGYRTAHEICRFVYFHKELSGDDWTFEPAMDAAIMQKLLPKLHGSKKKLGPVLAALINLCLKEAYRFDNQKTPIADNILIDVNALYPKSLEKLARMRKRLKEHGFTSFAEA